MVTVEPVNTARSIWLYDASSRTSLVAIHNNIGSVGLQARWGSQMIEFRAALQRICRAAPVKDVPLDDFKIKT